MNPPAPPVIILQQGNQQSRVPEPPAITPKLIEIPGVANAPAMKAQSSAIFILLNGERLETPHYMLTADNLSVTVDRQQRNIPISMLDINATVLANRERGIELRIPASRNEIWLSF
ncbi:MAG TPA: hypothetical protein VN622_01735 [Clostridia bacterium]|nr:hypothetical protein [Clostridia bacterium]